MQTNQLPHYDDSVNTTGCCAKFNPEGWDGEELHFDDKKFVRAETMAAMHIPINTGKVFTRVLGAIDKAGAYDNDNFIVLTNHVSPWKGEHYFAVDRDIEAEEMTSLSGDFVTKVFEGPYRDAGKWHEEMRQLVRGLGAEPGKVYFFYTTCPKCAKTYGKNHVVGLAEI